ncbi:MAG: restriction endonuclease subunit S [Atopobium sp.]|nr:restriction endonuclease subunit S [Atopobium sp.]
MTNKPQFDGERELVKLSEIAKIKAGNVAPKKDAFTEDGIPFVRAGSLTNLLAGESLADLEKIDDGTAQKLRLTLFPAGTVVFAKSGMSCMTGNVYVLPKPCYVVSHLACVIPNGNYASYLKHYFRFNRPNRLIENPSFPSIKLSKIQGIELRLPSLEEGVRQVQALERIESQIEQAKALLKYLDFLVKSWFVEMFGDPIENPFDWRTKPLSNLGNLKNGVNFKSVDSGTKIRCLSVSDFKDCYQISNMELISYVSLNNKPNKTQLLRDGDVVFVRSNGNKRLVGRCLAIFPGDEDVTFSGFCIRFHNESNELLLDYLLGCLKSDSMRKAMTGRGANIQNLSQKILSEVVLPIPPLTLQQEFATFVQHVDKSRFVAQQQIEKLQMLYDSLAQEYFGD